MTPLPHRIRHADQGFSIVEVMVAMVIGMIGIIVMMQVFALFEGQKRTTTGGTDAQTTGAIAMYEIEREIKQAGYGTSSFNMIGCDVTLLSGITLTALAPVTINYAGIPAGDPNTDTLLIAYSGTDGQTEGDNITGQPFNNVYAVATSTSFSINDVVIAQPKNLFVTPPAVRPACALTMTAVTNVTDPDVSVTAGIAGLTNGLLYNLGQAPTIKINAYAIRNGSLTVCNFMANDCGDPAQKANPQVWLPIASNIVSMKAVYGVDTSATIDGILDGPSTTLPAAVSTQCSLMRVPAVGIALVARNNQFNKEVVTNTAANAPAPPNAPTWMADNINPILGNPSPLGPGTAADENWKHYRYKVYETIAPIRNMNWQGVATGC